MKMKVYYGALALVWLLSGCNSFTQYDSENIESKTYDPFLGTITKVVYEKHDYLRGNNILVHLGTCKQCKHELDSIVKNAVSERKEGK